MAGCHVPDADTAWPRPLARFRVLLFVGVPDVDGPIGDKLCWRFPATFLTCPNVGATSLLPLWAATIYELIWDLRTRHDNRYLRSPCLYRYSSLARYCSLTCGVIRSANLPLDSRLRNPVHHGLVADLGVQPTEGYVDLARGQIGEHQTDCRRYCSGVVFLPSSPDSGQSVSCDPCIQTTVCFRTLLS